MRVLFVSSGNSKNGISSIVKNQGESLINKGIKINYFTIKGKGFLGYLKNISVLRKYFRESKYDIVHAHYSKSAYVASIASFGLDIPVICSLMGSDIQANKFTKAIINFFYTKCWKITIAKSERMKQHIGFDKAYVIPNGVNFERFRFFEKEKAQEFVGFDKGKINIIWVSNPDRYEKNFLLAENAIIILNNKDIKLNIINGVIHQDIPKYMSAADALLLTSLWEGSPNVIKEAMASNCPIVSTDVGDVRWILGETEGCYITTFDHKDVAEKLKLALKFSGNKECTNGRERIIRLGLDSEKIAQKIINIYEDVLKK